MNTGPLKPALKGRGAQFSPLVRFDAHSREQVDDGWGLPAEDAAGTGWAEPPAPKTVVTAQPAKSIISRNQSPDVPFTQSINPYYSLTAA